MMTRPAKLQPGDRIDGFVLKERLHQGGMATVWDVTEVDAEGEPCPRAEVGSAVHGSRGRHLSPTPLLTGEGFPAPFDATHQTPRPA